MGRNIQNRVKMTPVSLTKSLELSLGSAPHSPSLFCALWSTWQHFSKVYFWSCIGNCCWCWMHAITCHSSFQKRDHGLILPTLTHGDTHTHTLSQFPASSVSSMGSEYVLKPLESCPDALYATLHQGYSKSQESTDLKPDLAGDLFRPRWCMRQVLRPGAQGRPRGIGWRGRWEGGSIWGIHVNPWLIHVIV